MGTHLERSSVRMKLLVSLGLIAYVSALHDSQCSKFITVKRSRNKRSPQWWNTGSDATTGATTAFSVATGDPSTTVAPTTVATTGASTTATQPPVTTTADEKTTTEIEEVFTVSTDAPIEGQGTDYLILLDATGSMQKLSGPGRGREFVITRFNKFLKVIRNQVSQGSIQDGKIVVATFNKAATWIEYNSIENVEDLNKRAYNPGYGTNLYDTIGCALQKFKEESSAAQKLVYILTDGIHQVKRSTYVAHTVDEVSEMVNSYRDEEGMQSSFLAMINPEDKEALKTSAKEMGIRGAEIRTSDFNGRQFSVMLKTVPGGMKKGAKEKFPTCKSLRQKCSKGRAGKNCRTSVKRTKASGRCTV